VTSTEYLLTLGIPRERILQIQNAVDKKLFLCSVQPQFQIKVRPVLLYVGQLIARKGVEALLKVATMLQREGYEFSLLLVGNGHDKEALRHLAADLELQNVYFRPPLPPEKMPSVYRSGDILVFPTLEDVWGLVANEAVLSGLTVLCSKYAGCAQELFSPRNIFDPEDTEEFKQKLRDVLRGDLPVPDPSRLLTTPQILETLIQGLESSLDERARGRIREASTGDLGAAKY
jgi:glycosyltransferase involved in cell wall biosynthesis